MIKAVIFDVGGVILNLEQLAIPVMETFRPEDKEKFWQDLNEKFSPLCRGEGNLYDFWKALAKDHGKNIPEERLRTLWNDDFEKSLVINKDVLDIIKKLKKKGYRLAIISNIITEHAGKLRNNSSFSELSRLFDLIIFSNEVRMAKDSKEIFALALKELGLKPEECVFTDDTQKFVDMASSIGIKAVRFTTAGELKKYLKSINLNT